MLKERNIAETYRQRINSIKFHKLYKVNLSPENKEDLQIFLPDLINLDEKLKQTALNFTHLFLLFSKHTTPTEELSSLQKS